MDIDIDLISYIEIDEQKLKLTMAGCGCCEDYHTLDIKNKYTRQIFLDYIDSERERLDELETTYNISYTK